jgi:DNA polymerase III delta prime subunit
LGPEPSSEKTPTPPLDALAERIEGILRRKGQVVLYGPPGTGKTYRALAVAKDLAARRSFGRISPLLQKRSARGSRAPTVWFVSAPFIQAMVTRTISRGCGLASFCRKTIESKMSYIDFQDTLPLLCVSFRKVNLYGGWVKPWRSILGGFLRPDRAGFAENAWELA